MAVINKYMLGLFAQAALSLAVPGALEDRTTCNRDNCLRAVIANNAKPGPVSASEDCLSFFRKTVTPCEETSTTTLYKTKFNPPPTITEVETKTITESTYTDIITVPYTVTEATEVVTTTVATDSIQATVTESVTKTEFDTVTDVKTVYGPPFTSFYAPPKPTIKARADGDEEPECPKTQKNTVVPTYASACSGTVRYSSACSCIGATSTIVTVSLPTQTVTNYKWVTVQAPGTVTVTETDYTRVVATVTETSSVRIDATLTNYESVTATITLTPSTVTDTQTERKTVTYTITNNLPGPTAYCKMYLQAKGGKDVFYTPVDKAFIYHQSDRAVYARSSNKKSKFQLGTGTNSLHVRDGSVEYTLQFTNSYNPAVYVVKSTGIDKKTGQSKPLTCNVNSSTLELTCLSYKGGAAQFWSGFPWGGNPTVLLDSKACSYKSSKIYAVPVDCKVVT